MLLQRGPKDTSENTPMETTSSTTTTATAPNGDTGRQGAQRTRGKRKMDSHLRVWGSGTGQYQWVYTEKTTARRRSRTPNLCEGTTWYKTWLPCQKQQGRHR